MENKEIIENGAQETKPATDAAPVAAPAEKPKTAPKKKPAQKSKRPATPKEKLAFLWRDKRSWKQRLFNALPVSFAIAFTFFFFEPLEVYITNNSFFAFGVRHLTPLLVFCALAVFAGLSAIMTLLRGKIHNAFVCLSFAWLIAGYLQCNLLNIDHGTLDGTEILWQDFKVQALLNLLLWVLIALIPFAVHYLFPVIWKNGVRALPVLLTVMQIVAMVSLIWKTDSLTNVSDNGYLTTDGIYEVSEDNNVVVFLVDRFDKKYADAQLEADPDLENALSGFTFYRNFTGSYSRTFPSVIYFLTGVPTDYSIKPNDYMKKAWTETTFLPAIKEAGNDVRVYSEVNYVMGNAEWTFGTIDNATRPTGRADGGRILSAMLSLSAYRWTPEALKPYFHFYTGDISFSYIYGADLNIYGTDDVRFREGLVENGITVDGDSNGTFLFYHLQGSHDPYYMDENGNRTTFASESEGLFRQTKGDLNTVIRYCQELKEQGLFDKTTIIITADHGRTGTLKELADSAPGDTGERVLSLFIKPAGADASEPLAYSDKQICVDNLRASILSYFGLGTDGVRTVESIGETEEMERYFRMNAAKNSIPASPRDYNLVTYRIVGDANDFSNWEKTSVERIKYPYYDAGRTSKVKDNE